MNRLAVFVVVSLLMAVSRVLPAQPLQLVYYSDVAFVGWHKGEAGINKGYKVIVVESSKAVAYSVDSIDAVDRYVNSTVTLIKRNGKTASLLPPFHSEPAWKKDDIVPPDVVLTQETKTIAGYECSKAILKTRDGDIVVWFTKSLGNNNFALGGMFRDIPGTVVFAYNDKVVLFKLEKVNYLEGKTVVDIFFDK